jgi:hypothetical protein
MNVVKRGILIPSATKLGSGSDKISTIRKLNGSLTLPTTIVGVVGTLQMVFTNLIMNTHVNKTANRPLMNSMATGGYKSVNAINPKKGYQKPSTIIAPILDHKDGHYVRPNKVVFKYLDFKKDVDPNAHVRMFNSIIKTIVETSKEYIINMFNYTLRDITSD